MANSGIQWIDYTFNLAVRWLYACADMLGSPMKKSMSGCFASHGLLQAPPCSFVFLC